MARKEVVNNLENNDKKLRTKDLIFAGAFGAIYIVLMLLNNPCSVYYQSPSCRYRMCNRI